VVAEPAPSVAEPASSVVAEPAPATMAEPASSVVAEPAPSVVAEPAPATMAEPASSVVAEPAPAVAEPAPHTVAEPAPSVAEPAPATMAPVVAEPAPSVAEPAPHTVTEPASSVAEPAPHTVTEPAPSVAEPAPHTVAEPAPSVAEPAPQIDQPAMAEPSPANNDTAPANNDTAPAVDQPTSQPTSQAPSTPSCSFVTESDCNNAKCTWIKGTDACGETSYTTCRTLCLAGPTKYCYRYMDTDSYFVFTSCVNTNFQMVPDKHCLCNTTAAAVVANLPLSVTDINAKLGSTVPFVVTSFAKDSYITLAISNTPSADPQRRAETAAAVGSSLKSLYSGLAPYNLEVQFGVVGGQNYAYVFLVPILNVQPTPPTVAPTSSQSTLSSGAIAGIVVGLTLGLILIVFVVVAVLKATEKKPSNRDVSTVYENL